MVDAADHEKLDASKNELHSLLDKPQLAGIPVRPPSPSLSFSLPLSLPLLSLSIFFQLLLLTTLGNGLLANCMLCYILPQQ